MMTEFACLPVTELPNMPKNFAHGTGLTEKYP